MMTNISDDNETQLSAKQSEFAANYLNENPLTSPAIIQEIRKWIDEDDKLCAHTDDFSIIRFLRSCKFDVDKTKKKLHNYYEQRTQLPEWYGNRDPFLPKLQEMLDLGVFLPLRGFDEDGRMVILIQTCVHDPQKHSMDDVIKAGMMVLDLATRNNVSVTIHGVVAIFDMTGVTMGHGLQMTPSIIQKLVHSWQGCYPLKIQSLNFINAPFYVNVVLNIFKRFMTKKLRSKMNIHIKSTEKFLSSINPQIIPIEYNGQGGSLQELKDHWKNQVQDNSNWFKEEEKYRVIT